MKNIYSTLVACLAIGQLQAQVAENGSAATSTINEGASIARTGGKPKPTAGHEKSAIVALGDAANVYTLLVSAQNQITYDPDLNAVVFVHRHNPGGFGGQGGTGTLRFDISADGGTNWTLNHLLTPNIMTFSIKSMYCLIFNKVFDSKRILCPFLKKICEEPFNPPNPRSMLNSYDNLTTMIETDILIIGAGPVGLFTVFEAGLVKLRCHLLDYLPQPGGQLTEIYPKKPIYISQSRFQLLSASGARPSAPKALRALSCNSARSMLMPPTPWARAAFPASVRQ